MRKIILPLLAAALLLSCCSVCRDESWALLLVGPTSPLPSGFEVKTAEISGGLSADARVCQALEALLSGARAAGFSPIVCSAYRSAELQTALYANKVSAYVASGLTQAEAEAAAAKWVAPPGTSEHQTGLAFDIVSEENQRLEAEQADTPLKKWLVENCRYYGFILRYPAGKTELTGISYEPWHYRYVGLKAAGEIADGGLCLEEYLAASAS